MWKKRLNSFGFALKGISLLFRSQVNARIHAAAALLALAAGCFFGLSATEWCLVVLCIGLVLMAEAFNSALEMLTDLVSPDFHPLAGKAKDLAAGAVLLMAIGAATVGAIVFLPKVMAWLE